MERKQAVSSKLLINRRGAVPNPDPSILIVLLASNVTALIIGPSVTVRVAVTLWLIPLAVPVVTTVYVPVGVFADVLMVNAAVLPGLTLGDERAILIELSGGERFAAKLTG